MVYQKKMLFWRNSRLWGVVLASTYVVCVSLNTDIALLLSLGYCGLFDEEYLCINIFIVSWVVKWLSKIEWKNVFLPRSKNWFLFVGGSFSAFADVSLLISGRPIHRLYYSSDWMGKIYGRGKIWGDRSTKILMICSVRWNCEKWLSSFIL